MAKKIKKAAKKPKRKVGFGRREKLVLIGVLGIVAVGALHFVVFKPGVSEVVTAKTAFEGVKTQYESGASRYDTLRIEQYEAGTAEYREDLYEVLLRERFDLNSFVARGDEDLMRNQIIHLWRDWTEHQSTRDPEATDLAFIAEMPLDQVNRAQTFRRVQAGQYTWNLPTGLPEGITESVVQDNVLSALGDMRLISMIRGNAAIPQNKLNQSLNQLGVPVELLGIDKTTFAETPHAADYYLEARDGLRLANRDLNPMPVARGVLAPFPLRLPNPIDTVCALAHIEILLDALVEAPFDEATLARANENPDSLTPAQRVEYDRWLGARRDWYEGDANRLGLKDLFDVQFLEEKAYFSPALFQLERIINQGIDTGLTSILQVKIYESVAMKSIVDPWEPPVVEEQPEQQASDMYGGMYGGMEGGMMGGGMEGGMMAGGMEGGMMAGMEGGMLGGMYGGMYGGQQGAAVEEEEDAYVYVVPIFLSVQGNHAQVMEYFLWLSTGPNFYRVEEVAFYNSTNDGTVPMRDLPDEHVIGEFWVLVPVFIPSWSGEELDSLIRDAQEWAASRDGSESVGG